MHNMFRLGGYKTSPFADQLLQNDSKFAIIDVRLSSLDPTNLGETLKQFGAAQPDVKDKTDND